MLVLTRKSGERICIGGDIWVTVVHCDSGKVRLGIDAPRDVVVMREELMVDGRIPKREPVSYLYNAPPAPEARP